MRIVVIGGGSIGERQLRCFAQVEGVKVSICEPVEEKLERLKATYPVEEAYRDFDDVPLADFDATVVCAPANFHVPMSLEVVKAGRHVLSEKPLSVHPEGCQELIDAAKDKGVVAGVAYVYRHIPGTERMWERVRAGDIGEIMLVLCKSGHNWPLIRPEYRNLYFAKLETGGGAILDMISHLYNYGEWLAGRETQVACFYEHKGLEGITTEDTVLSLMRYESGAMGDMHLNLYQWDTRTEVEVVGSEGTLRYEGGPPPRLGLCRKDTKEWEWEEFPAERDVGFIRQANHFVKAVRGEAQVRCTLEEALWTLKVCWWMRQSQDEGRFVQCA